MAPTQNNRIAMVYCAGGSRAKRRGEADLSYLDCSMAKQAFADGVLECAQGCLGLGSCVEACRLDAIHIGVHGAAVVDREACVGCGLCVEACPQGRGHHHRAPLLQSGCRPRGPECLRRQLHHLPYVRAQLSGGRHYHGGQPRGHRSGALHLLRNVRGKVPPGRDCGR